MAGSGAAKGRGGARPAAMAALREWGEAGPRRFGMEEETGLPMYGWLGQLHSAAWLHGREVGLQWGAPGGAAGLGCKGRAGAQK